MSYTKVGTWQNNVTPPAINATNLANIETGIYAAHTEETIAALKALSTSTLSTGVVRNVLGYYAANDGGGGLFRYNSTSSVADDAGTIIAPNAGSGRWERVFGREDIPAEWFGAKGDGSTNDTTAIQKAIDLANARVGGVVTLAAKRYMADGLVLKDGVRLYGQGSERTFIRAISGSSNTQVFSLATGRVQQAGINWLAIEGNGNSGQHGLNFVGVAGGFGDGGLWYSNFDDLVVGTFSQRFSGACIRMDGGATFTTPMQFLVFNNVRAWNTGVTNARSIKFIGQVGQTTWINGDFECAARGTGTIAELDGYSHNFFGVAFQYADKAMLINGVSTTHVEDCWFESANHTIDIPGPSATGIRITGTHFGNCGSDGSGTGYILRGANGCFAIFKENHVNGTLDTIIAANSGIIEAGTTWRGGVSTNPTTTGITFQLTAAATLDLYEITDLLVTASATQVATINATLMPGKQARLRSWNGPVTYNDTGNLSLGGWASPLVIPDKSVATFMRVDLAESGKTWLLQSVSQANKATLTADVTNATTSYADITGLTFPVTSGNTYRFRATIIFTVNATTTGSAWSVNGPASPTQLAYTVTYPSVTATYPQPPSLNSFAAYNAMTATTATPATTGNLAEIGGIIQPSASGTFAIRFASEVAVANGVTAKAGSSLEYW